MIDWQKIEEYLERIGYVPMAPSLREECKLRIKDAFAQGKMVAGTQEWVKTGGVQVGCALGQIGKLQGQLGPIASELIVTVNNFACTRDGEIPAGVCDKQGIPRHGGSCRVLEPLVRIEPLLELLDRL